MLSCSNIACPADELSQPIYQRMPAILDPEANNLWLDPVECAPATLNYLLAPVSRRGSGDYCRLALGESTKNDSPECILPI